MTVSVTRTSRDRTLTIWRTSPSQLDDVPSCKYEYHCAGRDGSMVLKKLSCEVYPPRAPTQEQEGPASGQVMRMADPQPREPRFGHDFSRIRVR
ncbi:MAG TPA: hypothetical protein VE974_04560 [Thermoanaerobaculia bacterium]|nr:hypothetical protein [Thermoanaerobaculia bacterium]